MVPLPVAGVGPSPRCPRHGIQRRPTRRLPPSTGVGRVIEDEVGVRNTVALPTGDVLVIVRAARAFTARTRLGRSIEPAVIHVRPRRGPGPTVPSLAAHGAPVAPTPAGRAGVAVATIAIEEVGCARAPPARLSLGQGLARKSGASVPRARVLVGPAAPVMRQQRVIVGRLAPALIPQEALEGRERQVPSLVGRPPRLGVRRRKPRPGPARKRTSAAIPSRSASGQSDAGIHGLTLGTSGLVTRLAKRAQEARIIREAKVALGNGVPTPASAVAALADGRPAAASVALVTRPPLGRTTPAVEGRPSSGPRARAAARPRPRPPSLADVPAKPRSLPQVTKPILGQGARAAAVGSGIPTVVRRGPPRRVIGAQGQTPMANPLRMAPAAAAALLTAPRAAPLAPAAAAARATRPATCGAVDVLRLQAREVGPVVVISLPHAKPPASVTPAVGLTATRPLAPAARARPILGRPAEIPDLADVDAPAVIREARNARPAGGVELSITPRAPTAGAVVRAWPSPLGAIRIAEASLRKGGAARTLIGAPTTPSAAPIGPAVLVGLPALARVEASRGRCAVETSLPVPSSAMERRARRAALAITLTAGGQVAALVAARRVAAVALARAHAPSRGVLVAPTVLPAGSAFIPTIEVLRGPPSIRQVPPTLGPAIVGVGRPTRERLLGAGPDA